MPKVNDIYNTSVSIQEAIFQYKDLESTAGGEQHIFNDTQENNSTDDASDDMTDQDDPSEQENSNSTVIAPEENQTETTVSTQELAGT